MRIKLDDISRQNADGRIFEEIIGARRSYRLFKLHSYSRAGGIIYDALRAANIITPEIAQVSLGHQKGRDVKEFVFFVKEVPYVFAEASHENDTDTQYRISACYINKIAIGQIITLGGGRMNLGTVPNPNQFVL